MGDVKLNSTGGGSVTLTPPSTASNLTLTLPSASGTVATTSGSGSVFTNPTINGFTGDTSVINIGSGQFYKDTSGNVGIGTTSPGAKLQVIGGLTQFQLNAAGTQQVLQLNNSDTTAGTQAVKLGFSSAGTTKASINCAVYGNDYMAFNVGSDTERMRLDSSGNLGLGVTPSAWSSGKAIQFGTLQAGIWGVGDQIDICSNAYYDSAWKASATKAGASLYEQALGTHYWYVSGSVTAGNAISFTNAMTLNASGNLALGHTSTPSTRLDVRTSLSATANPQWVSDFYAITSGSTDGTYGGGIRLHTKNANGNYWPAAIAAINDAGGSNLSSLGFYTAAAGATLTERARIDSSGNLLVGTTSTQGRLTCRGGGTTNSTWNIWLENSSGTASFLVRDDGYVRSPTTYNITSGSAANVYIDSNGYFYRSTSSLKYKTDVTDANHGLSELL